MGGVGGGGTRLKRFLPKNQRELLNFENWVNGGGVKKYQNLTIKVIFFFIEEYQFRSTFYVIDIF